MKIAFYFIFLLLVYWSVLKMITKRKFTHPFVFCVVQSKMAMKTALHHTRDDIQYNSTPVVLISKSLSNK